MKTLTKYHNTPLIPQNQGPNTSEAKHKEYWSRESEKQRKEEPEGSKGKTVKKNLSEKKNTEKEGLDKK